jgi:hypothetical protein
LEFVANALEQYLDSNLAFSDDVTDLLPPTVKAIILEPGILPQTRTRWLLVYIENSANQELQSQFVNWMENVDGLHFLVKLETCTSIFN